MLGLWRQLVVSELNRLEPDFATWGRCLHCVEKEIEDRAVKQIIVAYDD